MPLPAVRTRRTTTVVPLPSVTAGAGGRRRRRQSVALSPLDTRWVALPPVCHVFLFPLAAAVPFPDVVRALRSSLAAALRAFHPFAGEVAYSPETGTVSIVVCDAGGGGGGGVAFVESETDLDFARLVAGLDVHALPLLVSDIRRDELPAPVFAAQVTEFVGGSRGGMAVGVALNHAATDGVGFFRFMETWAAAAAAGVRSERHGMELQPQPLHDRRLVRFDGDEELAGRLLRQVAPDLPRLVPKQQVSPPTPKLSRRTYTFSAHALRRLKHRLTAATITAATTAPAAPPPSTFATLAAHAWVSFAAASDFTDAAPVFIVFLADCRAHIMSPPPPPDAYYAGNCVASCVVALSGAELTGGGDGGLARAFEAVRDAAAAAKRDPLAGAESWVARFRAAPPGRKVVLAGSPWFPPYGVDFGFGTPARVERAVLEQDGAMAVFAGREQGSVQVSVAVTAGKMDVFNRMFDVESGSDSSSRL